MRGPWPAIAAGLLLLTGGTGGCLQPPPPVVSNNPGDGADANVPLWAAKPVGELYAPGEIRAFHFQQMGQSIGTAWGKYVGPEEVDGQTLHRFEHKIERLLALGDDPNAGQTVRGYSVLWVDDAGELVRGFERSAAAELKYDVKDGVLQAEAYAGVPKRERWEVKIQPGMAYMGYMTMMLEEMMLAQRDLKAGELAWPLLSLSSAQPDEWSGRAARAGAAIEVRTSLGEVITFADGKITQASVADIELEVRPSNEPWPTWDIPAPPELAYTLPEGATFTPRPVELPGKSGQPRLAGEVLVPKAASADKPRPGVLFLAGSAQADRWGFAGPPAVDLGSHAITDALAQAGYVVLRYDDRSTGESAVAAHTWLGQLDDARRAYATLLVQPEVDPDRILVVGHAEGAWRALALAQENAQAKRKGIVGIAALGANAASYTEMFAGQPELVKSLRSGVGLPELLQAHRQWYMEILDVDPASLLKKHQTPLFVAHGDKDFEVMPDAPQRWKKAAKKFRNPVQVKRYPTLDHLFKEEPGQSSQQRYLVTRDVDATFLGDLTAWALGIAAVE